MKQTVLEMVDVSMQFSGVYALKEMQFELCEGEVHALVGENGAGKSTLIKVLGGIYKPVAGKILIRGQEVHLQDVKSAQEHGISIIHQEICLVPWLSVSENIFLGRELQTKFGFKDKHSMRSAAQKMMDDLQIEIDADTLVVNLTIAQQQLVEIVKAVSFDAKILVLDEPTSSLSMKETEQLFTIINRLRESGVSMIYISHRLEEIFHMADRVTVIRDGSFIGRKNVSETDADELVRMMVGRQVENYYTRTYNVCNEVALEVRNLTKHGVFENASFKVHRGEILGFAGLVGSGRSEMMMSVFGADSFDSGQILLKGREVRFKSAQEAIAAGIGLVPESRKEQGLVLVNSVGFNITLAALRELVSAGLVSARKAGALISRYADDFGIKMRTSEQRVSELSGGNQQKVVLGKWLATNPDVLILDEPTRGVDVGAKAEIYAIMNQLASEGLAIIMVSSELAEIINMCDRVCVVHEGKITGELTKEAFSQDRIMRYATGGVDENA